MFCFNADSMEEVKKLRPPVVKMTLKELQEAVNAGIDARRKKGNR